MYLERVKIPSFEGTFAYTFSKGAIEQFSDPVDGDITRDQAFGNSITLNALRTFWAALLGDSPLSDRKPNSSLMRFCKELEEDVVGLAKRYASISDAILNSSHNHDGTTKRVFIHDMQKLPVFREYLHWYKSGDAGCLKYVLTFLNYGKKVPIVDPSFQATALRGWLEVEDRLASVSLPPFVDSLRAVVYSLFDNFDPTGVPFRAKHGNGSVSEKGVWGIRRKNAGFAMSWKLLEFLDELREVSAYPESITTPNPYPVIKSEKDQCSRLHFVPKDLTKDRSICMEPTSYQWAQQACLRMLVDHIASDPILNRIINLSDQTQNQERCRLGSQCHSYDTIDLSSASDSVLWSLVEYVFPPEVTWILHGTRSEYVTLPNGTVAKPLKFAPMGSAVCFPVQCLLFAGVTILVQIAHYLGKAVDCLDLERGVVRDYYYRSLTDNPEHNQSIFSLPPSIYGDDIICDSQLTSNVIAALQDLGFAVNVGKSFLSNCNFRESCGLFAMEGNDVTPLRYKTRISESKVDVDAMAGLIDHANLAGDFGYASLRSHVIRYLRLYGRTHSPRPVLFSRDRDVSFSIFVVKRPRNERLMRRYNTDLQVHELRSLTSASLIREPILDQDWYFYSLASSMNGSNAKYAESIMVPTRVVNEDWWQLHGSDIDASIIAESDHMDRRRTKCVYRWTRDA